MTHRDQLQRLAIRQGVNISGKRTCSYKASLEGLAWAGVDDLVSDIAREEGLDLIATRHEKSGLLRRTTHFTVRGPENIVYRFLTRIGESLDAYEADTPPATRPAKLGFFSRLFS